MYVYSETQKLFSSDRLCVFDCRKATLHLLFDATFMWESTFSPPLPEGKTGETETPNSCLQLNRAPSTLVKTS